MDKKKYTEEICVEGHNSNIILKQHVILKMQTRVFSRRSHPDTILAQSCLTYDIVCDSVKCQYDHTRDVSDFIG